MINALAPSVSKLPPPQTVFSGEDGFNEAVTKIRDGKIPYAFVSLLSPQEQASFDGLSSGEVWNVFQNAISQNERDQQVLNNPRTMNAELATQKIIAIARRQTFSSFIPIPGSFVPKWHTDEKFSLQEPRAHNIRMSFAAKGKSTQFFYPTQPDYENFLATPNIEQVFVTSAVNPIVEQNPDRIIMGRPYDICLFNTGVIHRSPPHDLDSIDRRLLAGFGGPIKPLSLQYGGPFSTMSSLSQQEIQLNSEKPLPAEPSIKSDEKSIEISPIILRPKGTAAESEVPSCWKRSADKILNFILPLLPENEELPRMM